MDISQQLLQSSFGEQWKRIGVCPHHGIDVPIFSLHSSTSCGIGEYPDLLPLISWCKQKGFDVIQILPINDLGIDSSPYGAISAFALNPLYLGLSQLPYLEDYPDLVAMLPAMQQLVASQRIDYFKVRIAKQEFLHAYYKHVGSRFISTEAYQQFLNENDWIKGFALYKTLKNENQWQSWELWLPELRNPSVETYEKLLFQYSEQISYHQVIQFLCFQQMEQVKQEAEKHGVFLKGDIPILINRDSADVWLHRHIFRLDLSAGAPPDVFSEEGQDWGFPIYDWKKIEEEDYIWWKKRLKVAEKFYHIYRLDHMVGFFRIWGFPYAERGEHGAFFPNNEPNVYLNQGIKIIQDLLVKEKMLPIAEDLGSVPDEVRKILHDFGICGTRVMRWERYWKKPEKPFIPYSAYWHITMTTVSTHDSETLQLWWENTPSDAKAFALFKGWDYTFDLNKTKHQEILYDSHHTPSLFHINLLQEYLALIPGMIWPNPDDERINVPGVVSDHNWTYRFKPSVEEITTNQTLVQIIRELIT